MKIQVLKNETYKNIDDLPVKGTDRSTGYDIIATSEPEIIGDKTEIGYKRIDYIQYKTNLKIAVQKEIDTNNRKLPLDITDYDVLAFPRSSISKYNLQLANSIGLIDADYRGEVLLRFNYLWQPQDFVITTHDQYDENQKISYIIGKPNLDKIYKKGDKICQLKVTKVEKIEFILVNELDATDRGDGGFGSTDSNKPIDDINEIYKKQSFYTPDKKYLDLIKEREQKINNL